MSPDEQTARAPAEAPQSDAAAAEGPETGQESPGFDQPRAIASLTPMLRHYLQVKAVHPDAILLYRMGDFYETFFEDAEIAAPIFEIQLTARQRGTPSEAPMCGVPHHAIEGYIGKLLKAGLKVAVCDQVEDPAQAQGLVRREVTRVVTPGTVSELTLLERSEPNYLACLLWRDGRGAAAFLDVSTGAFFVQRFDDEDAAIEELARSAPSEVLAEAQLPALLAGWLETHVACRGMLESGDLETPAAAEDRLRRQLEVGTVRSFGLESGELAVLAAARVLEYAQAAVRADLGHVRQLEVRRAGDALILDETTLRNLEVFRNLRDQRREGTLLAAVDRTVSAPGARRLREWLSRPLQGPIAIERRLEAVQALVDEPTRRSVLRQRLSRLADLERLVSRAVLGNLSPLEAGAMRDTLEQAPEVLAMLAGSGSPELDEIARTDPVAGVRERLRRSLVEQPPSSLKDGGVIADGLDPELDRLRSLTRDAKQHLLRLESNERSATGINSLKVRYNRVFGYFIEVTRANRHLVPEERYIRKQTLANAERFFTGELKELEEQILGAEERRVALEQELFDRLRLELAQEAGPLRTLAGALARLDVLASFAEVAARHGYCRPRVERDGPLAVLESRHPVVEQSLTAPFVPNDVELGEDARIVLLTGPNMGGKSTYLRQVALIALLAHAGSFVPAASARLPLLDRIFTRVGASDNLARGESTFMVEMIETANILRYATERSLVILDEVGRGTSTYDGLSLAWAIVEHLHQESRALTLFATHYHELTELARTLEHVRNRTMTVKEWHDQIVFLHRVVPGAADKSYGIQVARLAGLPVQVIRRASEILHNLEAEGRDLADRPRWAAGEHAPPAVEPVADQLSLFARADEVVLSVLRELDLDRLTPLAALNLLQTLKARLDSGVAE